MLQVMQSTLRQVYIAAIGPSERLLMLLLKVHPRKAHAHGIKCYALAGTCTGLKIHRLFIFILRTLASGEPCQPIKALTHANAGHIMHNCDRKA